MGYLEKPKDNENINWKPRKQLLFKSSKFDDEKDREKAIQGLKQLKQIRILLLAKLESKLAQVNDWIEHNPEKNEKEP